MTTGLVIAALGALFFVVRVPRYDLFLALYGSDVAWSVKFLADPRLLDGDPLRAAVLAAMPPGQALLAGAAVALGVDGFAVEYALLLALNVGAAAAAFALAWTLFRDRWSAVLAAAVVVGGSMGGMALGSDWRLGHLAYWHYVAVTGGLVALALVYRRAYVKAAFVAGLLMWVQPSHALIVGAVVVVAHLGVEGRPAAPRLALAIGAFAVAAAPAVMALAPAVPALLAPGIDADTWWDYMRARKHTIFPFSGGVRFLVGLALVAAAGLIARAVMAREDARVAREDGAAAAARERVTVLALVTLAVICAVGVAAAELVPSIALTKLVLTRASTYAMILLVLYLCAFGRRLLASAAPAAMACGALALGLLVWLDLAPRYGVPLLVVVTAAGAFAASRAPRATLPTRVAGPVVAAVVVMALAHAYLQALMPVLAVGAYDGYRRPAEVGPWKDVQLWARAHTPPDAVFLNPPAWCGFQVFSERPAVMSHCDMGRSLYASAVAPEELARVRAYTGPAPLTRATLLGAMETRYEALSAPDVSRLGARFRAAYAVAPRPSRLALPVVYENPGFVVYRLGG